MAIWSLRYKHGRIDGYVNKFGDITRGRTEINIRNGKINKVKKPFFSNWKKALKNIDNMLQNMTEKFNNKKANGEKVVNQKQINILTFSKEAMKKIQEAQAKITRFKILTK